MHVKTLCFLFFLTTLAAEPAPIYPPPIEKGDVIAIVLPASFLSYLDEEAAQDMLSSKLSWLESKGYEPILYPKKIKRIGYHSGTDEERAEALMDAWKDERVKAIWCFQGGHGSYKILDKLDYKYIQENPKIFIGMSDITALHIAIQQKTGFVTFLAPILNFFDQTHKDFDDEYAWVSLEKLLEDPTHQEVILPEEFKQEMLNPNKVQGKLVGGNLSLISAMCGTEWQLNTDGKILILEDVGEQIQWIDRKLWQLKNAGLLQKPAAVILANWKDCKPGFKHSLELQEVLNHYFQDAPYPVIIGYPTGHDKYQAALPLNAPFSINPININ